MFVFVIYLYFRPYLYCMQCFVEAQQGSGVITSRARMLHNHYCCLHHSQYHHRQHLASSASSTSSSFLCLSPSTSLYSFSLSSYQCHNFHHIMDIITIKNKIFLSILITIGDSSLSPIKISPITCNIITIGH